MLLLLSTLALGAEITVRQTPSGVQAIGASGQALTAAEFAQAVGDHETVAERQAIYRRMRASTGVLTWGGLGVTAVSGVGALVGLVESNDLMVLGFGSTGAVGALSFVSGGALYLASRNHLNDMDRWYTLQEAQAWVARMDEAREAAPPTLAVVPSARGYDVVYDSQPMSTQGFALHVGDLDTYRVCKTARTLLLIGSIGSFVVGGYGLLAGVAADSGNGVRIPLAMAGGSGLALGAGLFALRNVLDRPRIWYSADEAQALIDQADTASLQRDRSQLELAVGPTLLPDQDRLAAGVGLSGRW